MIGDIIGGIIGAGANLMQGAENRESNERINANNIAMQREFAQNGISWKVQDALKAGIHPLAALGASGASFSNIVGREDDSISKAGQDIGRAVAAGANGDQRNEQQQAEKLVLEKGALENELLRTRIAKMRGQLGPGIPSNGPQLVDGQPATDVQTVSGATVKSDDIKQKADTIPASKRIRVSGVRLYTNPWTSDAQDIEDRYGNIVENVAGIGNLVADGVHTFRTMKLHNSGYLPAPWTQRRRRSRPWGD